MRFAFMIITPDVQGSQVTGVRGPFEDLFPRLKELGYQGVEVMLKNPFNVDFDQIYSLSKKYDLPVCSLCTGEMYGEDKISLGDPDLAVRREALKRFKALVEAAALLNTHVSIGRARGRFVDGVPKEDTLRWVQDGLRDVAELNRDVHLLLEPINRYYENFIISTQDGVDFVKDLNVVNVRLMLDYMHLVIEEENATESVALAAPYLDHVHVCDSDRKPLGQGNLDLAPFFAALMKVGYKGYISSEAFPSDDEERDLRETIDEMNRFSQEGCSLLGEEKECSESQKKEMPNAILIDKKDNVLTTFREIQEGEVLVARDFDGTLVAEEKIPKGFKVAITAIPKGATVYKYGKTIGTATSDIGAGAMVHVHNIRSHRGKESKVD
ncbi:TIM barrel protein [Aminobacterium mobile]|uniref:TIM barrel protein n=1 Tax=Aminobacterium mobile TaxID=81467 RepID=UPI003315CEFC